MYIHCIQVMHINGFYHVFIKITNETSLEHGTHMYFENMLM